MAIHDAISTLGIEVRIGLHTGEVSPVGDSVEGIHVDIASRIVSLAGAGEVLVSSTVRDVVLGGDYAFIDRGRERLKGADTWQIYRAIRDDAGSGTSS